MEVQARPKVRTVNDTDTQADRATLIDPTRQRSDGRPSDKMGASEHPDFMMGKQLTDEQRQQMTEMLTEFRSVFQDTPGRTHLTTHTIQLTDETPCWQPSYLIPTVSGMR